MLSAQTLEGCHLHQGRLFPDLSRRKVVADPEKCNM